MHVNIPGLDHLEKRLHTLDERLDTLERQMTQLVTNTDQQVNLLTEIRDALTANRAAAPDRNGARRTVGRQMVGPQP